MAYFSLGLHGRRPGYRKSLPRDPMRVFQLDPQILDQVRAEGFVIVQMPDGSVHVWTIPEQADDVREAYQDCSVHILGQPFVIVDNTRPKRRYLSARARRSLGLPRAQVCREEFHPCAEIRRLYPVSR